MKKILFSLMLLISVLHSFGQAGTLDTSFGTAGITTFNFSSAGYEGIMNSCLQTDGKIVTLDSYSFLTQTKIILRRFNTNGSVDTSFGVNGSTETICPNIEMVATQIVVLPNGSFFIAGRSSPNCFFVHYSTTGVLDTSIGTNGFNSLSGAIFNPTSMILQPDGKILLGGSKSNSLSVVRVFQNGNIDTSFGVSGYADYPTNNGNNGLSISLQPDGKILALGLNSNPYNYFYRYTSNGIIDSSFGNNGIVTINPQPNYTIELKNLTVQTDSKIIVIANNYTGTDSSYGNLKIYRYNSNGTLDISYGTNGSTETIIANKYIEPYQCGLRIQPDGKLLIAGTLYFSDNSMPADLFLGRYLINGNLDTSFNSTGIVTYGGNDQYGFGIINMHFQQDGKIIVTGGFSIVGIAGAIKIFRYFSGLNLGNDDFGFGNEISVLPNPTSSIVNINSDFSIKAITLYDTLGRLLLSQEVNQSNFMLDISNQNKGIYLLKVFTEKGSSTQKIVKE